ncbi:uncharacterized protein LOC144704386 isoform X2 [Wolffia australiana]
MGPARCPVSPPRYPDLCGKHRLQVEIYILNREIGFLEEELQSLDSLQPASKSCKQLCDFVGAHADPLISQKKLWRKVSWVCCWGQGEEKSKISKAKKNKKQSFSSGNCANCPLPKLECAGACCNCWPRPSLKCPSNGCFARHHFFFCSCSRPYFAGFRRYLEFSARGCVGRCICL